jgi:hypothetical protein
MWIKHIVCACNRPYLGASCLKQVGLRSASAFLVASLYLRYLLFVDLALNTCLAGPKTLSIADNFHQRTRFVFLDAGMSIREFLCTCICCRSDSFHLVLQFLQERFSAEQHRCVSIFRGYSFRVPEMLAEFFQVTMSACFVMQFRQVWTSAEHPTRAPHQSRSGMCFMASGCIFRAS